MHITKQNRTLFWSFFYLYYALILNFPKIWGGRNYCLGISWSLGLFYLYLCLKCQSGIIWPQYTSFHQLCTTKHIIKCHQIYIKNINYIHAGRDRGIRKKEWKYKWYFNHTYFLIITTLLLILLSIMNFKRTQNRGIWH